VLENLVADILTPALPGESTPGQFGPISVTPFGRT
jgi:hypothetical protein